MKYTVIVIINDHAILINYIVTDLVVNGLPNLESNIFVKQYIVLIVLDVCRQIR